MGDTDIRACRHLSTFFIESYSGRILVPFDINNNHPKDFFKLIFKCVNNYIMGCICKYKGDKKDSKCENDIKWGHERC